METCLRDARTSCKAYHGKKGINILVKSLTALNKPKMEDL